MSIQIMLKKFTSAFAVLLFSFSVFAQKTLASDPSHSRIQFTVIHLGINDITGNLNTAEMRIMTDDKNFAKSKISFSGDLNSINTNIEARDKHLKSADFFDVDNTPKVEFSSTAITKAKQKNYYQLKGLLTMHGVTKPVNLVLVYRGNVINKMNQKKTYAYQVLGTVKRSDFNVGAKFPEAVISDLVRIKGDFELLEQ